MTLKNSICDKCSSRGYCTNHESGMLACINFNKFPKADDNERRLTFKNPKIRIGTGKPEWGAEPGKNYFVITWEA